MHTLSQEDFQLLNMLEDKTGVRGLDVLRTEAAMIFLVPPGSVSQAIGKQGQNRFRLAKAVGMPVEFVEKSDDLGTFVRNAFRPAQVRDVGVREHEGKKRVSVKVDAQDRGLAIGKGGERIKRARLLAKRYFDVDDIKLG